MYKILESSSLPELLLEEYFTPSFLGSRSLIILQNQNQVQWLKLELAKRKGISGGLNIKLPEEALRLILDRLDWKSLGFEPKNRLYMDNLKLVLLQKIQTICLKEETQDPQWNILKTFAGTGINLDHRRVYGLSNALAGSFYYYANNQPEIPKAWDLKQSYTATGDPTQEPWQRALWEDTFSAPQAPEILGTTLERLLDSGKDLKLLPPSFDRIVLLGSPFLSRQAFRFFLKLAENMEIVHLLLSPSRLLSRNPETPMEPLNSWGQTYKDFRRVGAAAGLVHPPVTEEQNQNNQKKTSLEQLQDFLHGQEGQFTPLDKSLQFISCTNRRRELEVLKDRLLDLLHTSDLQLQEIGIMAPDINLYAPLVEAVFNEAGPEGDEKLPHNLSDLKSPEGSRLKAFLKILGLTGGRISRKEILELFSHPVIRSFHRLSDRDYQSWERFLEETHVSWGWDRESRSSILETPQSVGGTWKKALDRVTITQAFGPQSRPVLTPQGNLEYPAATGDPQLAASLLELLKNLLDRLNQWQRDKKTLAQWCGEWEELTLKILGPGEETQERGRRDELELVFQRLRALSQDLPEELKLETWSWETILELFKDQADTFDHISPGLLIHGITFCNFRPLRTLPFKVIALLGMGEGQFPGMEVPPSFDLRDRKRSPMDRESTDLYTFFETVMAAGTHLLFFWQGQDESTGTEKPPAGPVQDLLDLITDHSELTEGHLIKKAPVNNYFPGSFLPQSILPGSSRRALQGALIYQREKSGKLTNPNLSRKTAPWPEAPFSFTDWGTLLTASIRFFFQKSLKIYLKPMDEIPEEENFTLEFFLKRQLYESVVREPNGASLLQEWSAKGFWGQKTLEKWEIQDLEISSQLLSRSFSEILPPGSWIEKKLIQSHPQFPEVTTADSLTYFQGNSGDIHLIHQVHSSLEKGPNLNHLVKTLLGWTWVLSQEPEEPKSLTLHFYRGDLGEISSFSLESPHWRSPNWAKKFTRELWKLGEDLIKNPIPLYAPHLEKIFEKIQEKPETVQDPQLLEETWEDWKDGYRSGNSDRDHPTTCPFLTLAFPQQPDWEIHTPRILKILKTIYEPFYTAIPREKTK